MENRLLSHETRRLFTETREAHQYTKLLLHPTYIPPLSRVRARARVRRFSTFVLTSSPPAFNTLCVNGLSVKASPLFPSHLPSPKVLGVYVLCTFHAKRRDLAATSRNEGEDGVERSRRRTTRWTKGEGKGEVKPSPLMRYRSRSCQETTKNGTFTRNSLSINRLKGKGEEMKVVFRKQLMRTRARKDGRKVGKTSIKRERPPII